MSAVLEVRGMSKRFGSLDVTRNVHLAIEQGARCALVGPNGAGKTTLVNLISGRLAPSAGEIWMDGSNVTALEEAARVKAGLGRTFQITSLFRRLTIEENVALAVAEQLGVGGRLRPDRSVRNRLDARVADVIAMLRLGDDSLRPVELLPYGVQRMVELGIALALAPKMLILDEPAAGVPRSEVDVIFDAIARLPESIAVLFVEHDIDVVFRFAARVVVLVSGEILADGTPQQISEHPQVRALYLGERLRG